MKGPSVRIEDLANKSLPALSSTRARGCGLPQVPWLQANSRHTSYGFERLWEMGELGRSVEFVANLRGSGPCSQRMNSQKPDPGSPCTAFPSKSVWPWLPRTHQTRQLIGNQSALAFWRERYWPGCSMRRVTSDQSGSCTESRATIIRMR
jgi:hypothetical protein